MKFWGHIVIPYQWTRTRIATRKRDQNDLGDKTRWPEKRWSDEQTEEKWGDGSWPIIGQDLYSYN